MKELTKLMIKNMIIDIIYGIIMIIAIIPLSIFVIVLSLYWIVKIMIQEKRILKSYEVTHLMNNIQWNCIWYMQRLFI